MKYIGDLFILETYRRYYKYVTTPILKSSLCMKSKQKQVHNSGNIVIKEYNKTLY